MTGARRHVAAELPTSRNRVVRALVGRSRRNRVQRRPSRRRSPWPRRAARAGRPPVGAERRACARARRRSSSRSRAQTGPDALHPAVALRVQGDGRALPRACRSRAPALYRLRVRFAGDRRNAPAQADHYVRAVRRLKTAGGRRRPRRLDDVAAGGPQLAVELELPVVAGEGHARRGTRRRAARPPRRGPCGRSARGRSGPGSAAYIGAGNAPPKRVLTSVMPRPISRSRNACTVHGPRTLQRLDDAAAELDELGIVEHRALDRLAAARLEHRARDDVQAAPLGVRRQSIENSGPSMRRCTIGSLSRDVAAKNSASSASRAGWIDVGARAPARLDHHRVRRRLLAGQDRRRRRQAEPLEQQVGLVLVVGRRRGLAARARAPRAAAPRRGPGRAPRCRGRSAGRSRRRRARRTARAATARTPGRSISGTATRWCAAYCAGASGLGSAATTVACCANALTMS